MTPEAEAQWVEAMRARADAIVAGEILPPHAPLVAHAVYVARILDCLIAAPGPLSLREIMDATTMTRWQVHNLLASGTLAPWITRAPHPTRRNALTYRLRRDPDTGAPLVPGATIVTIQRSSPSKQ